MVWELVILYQLNIDIRAYIRIRVGWGHCILNRNTSRTHRIQYHIIHRTQSRLGLPRCTNY